MAGWIKMPIVMEVGLTPGDFVLDWDPAPPTKKGGGAPNFWRISIVANSSMHEGAAWYWGRRRPRRHCFVGSQFPPPPPTKRAQLLAFQAHVFLWPNGCIYQHITCYGVRPLAHATFCYMRTQLPRKRTQPTPNFWPICLLAKWLDGWRPHLVER